ncbi:MAG: serine hydrolase [Solobacterium sp.]|nr:serine hydrolase [Solobacterium sp.]
MEKIKQFIEETAESLRTQWNLEGFTIAVVKDGETIFTKGYGKRNAEAFCDSKTVMPIGSATKSFTALILGMLVEEGKLTWDTKVIDVIPDLKLYDPEVAKRVTIRDLLSHRTGAASHDAHGVYCPLMPREDYVKTFQYLQPLYDLRYHFQYSNQMVVLAAYVAEKITGRSWEELVKERILNPLGMDQTTVCLADMIKQENKSEGYLTMGPAGNVAQPYLDLGAVAPAGGINSNAEDMAKYLLLQLSKGKGLISKASLDEMHKPQMFGSPYLWTLEEITETNYGLCWFTDYYRGTKMVSHGGNTLGFSSLVTLIPDHNLGIAILSNGTTNFMPNVLTYEIIDRVLGLDEIDWTQKLNSVIGPLFAAMGEAVQAKMQARIPDTKPSHSLEDYAGVYTHPGFGKIEIICDGDALKAKFNAYDGMVSHYHYDWFDITMFVYGMSFPVCFHTGMNGCIDGLEAKLEAHPAVDPVFFQKA